MPKKMSLGFILLAIAFLFMIVAVIQTGTDPIQVSWIFNIPKYRRNLLFSSRVWYGK
ncbi:transporter, Major Facilitator Superfamily domain protein [Clostridioides difficile DA00165]|nr:transporter, Major Facilitator Superfamily domain protein [Clostridioides difficile DA00165]